MDYPSNMRGFPLPLAPVAALSAGFACAAIVATLPAPWFESAVMATGLPSIVDAALPPLGWTARLLAGVLVLGLVTLVAFAPLAWLFGDRSVRVRWGRRERPLQVATPPVFRAPPPATPARPISAREELGAPFLSIKAPSRSAPASAQSPTPTPAPVPVPQVTETVEVAQGIYIPDRRRAPRPEPGREAAPPASVAGLLDRLETVLGEHPLPPRRPVDPAFLARIQALRAARRPVAA